MIIVGFANKAVDEARERIRGSFATSHILLPRKRVAVNLAPADVPNTDSGFDLAIAVAILLASSQVFIPFSKELAFIGELGLDGSTTGSARHYWQVIDRPARRHYHLFIPAANFQQAQLVPKVNLVSIDSLEQLRQHLSAPFR